MCFNAFSSTRRSIKGVLWMQNVSQTVYMVSGIVLRGYSAAAQNFVSILRNFVAMRNVKSKTVEWILVVLALVLGIGFNNRSWIGLLPVLGNLQYTLAMFKFRYDEQKLKIFFLINSVTFVIFNFAIQNYVGVLSDMIVVVTTAVVLIKEKIKTKNA